jgi:peptidoglycan/LPS O-acetylase OafA/YrhL
VDRHIRPLDGLRGVAVAGVLLFHAGHLEGGYLGVDLFFVLSGFLITSLLLREHERSGTIDLKRFWIRRARRLLPAALGLIVFMALFSVVIASGFELERIRSDAVATVLYVANWNAIISQHGYFDLFAAPSPLEHTWSLAIEEQFYLVWPIVVLVLLRYLKVRLQLFFVICLALSLVSFGLMFFLYTPGADASRVYMGTDTRASSILIGAVVATAIKLWGYSSALSQRIAIEVAAWAAVVGLAVAWTAMAGTADITYQGGMFACSIGAAIIIIAISNPEVGPLGKVLAVQPFVFLGIISYGLYLWHWPVYVVLDPGRTHLDGWSLTALRIAVSVVIAVVSYYLFEQPIRNGVIGRRIENKWAVLAAPAAAIIVLFLVISVTVVAAPPARVALAQGPGDPNDPSVLFVGDSGSFELAERFGEIAPELHLRVDNQAQKGCRVDRGDGFVKTIIGRDDVVGVLGPTCGDGLRGKVEQTDAKVAFLHLAGPASSEVKIDGEFRTPCDPLFMERFEENLRLLVKDVTSTGLTLMIANSPNISSDRQPEDMRAKIAEYTRCTNELIVKVQKSMPRTVLIDLEGWLCPGGGPCRTEEGGVILRTDSTHFIGEGGHIAARWLAPQIKARMAS